MGPHLGDLPPGAPSDPPQPGRRRPPHPYSPNGKPGPSKRSISESEEECPPDHCAHQRLFSPQHAAPLWGSFSPTKPPPCQSLHFSWFLRHWPTPGPPPAACPGLPSSSQPPVPRTIGPRNAPLPGNSLAACPLKGPRPPSLSGPSWRSPSPAGRPAARLEAVFCSVWKPLNIMRFPSQAQASSCMPRGSPHVAASACVCAQHSNKSRPPATQVRQTWPACGRGGAFGWRPLSQTFRTQNRFLPPVSGNPSSGQANAASGSRRYSPGESTISRSGTP